MQSVWDIIWNFEEERRVPYTFEDVSAYHHHQQHDVWQNVVV